MDPGGRGYDEVKRRLAVLDEEVRVTATRVLNERARWPCARGCDHCCRSLATPMRISRAEWERLEPRITGSHRTRLADERVCALLDAEGACTVYDARPIACRAYGFYVGRDGGRWCATIEDAPALTSGVVLGNHDALERSLAELGETRTLAEWFASKA